MSFGFGFGFPKADTVAAGGVPGGGASLRLNFLDSTTLDPRITFSRTSNATVFDNAGNLVYAPHNLLTNSESFDNVAWVKTSATIAANVAVAPDGTTTADTFTFAGAGGDQRATQGGVVPLGAICVFSVWLRGTAGQTVTIEIDTTAVVVVLTASWARYSVSGPSAATTAVCRVISRSGNTASVINVWGAQLNVANAPGVNLLTFSEQFDNAAWTKTNSSIQSNLLTFSEQFDNAAWAKSNSFIQTNQIRNNTMQGAVAGTPGTLPTNWAYFANGGLTTSVVGTGTQNGISYIDLRLNGTTSGTFAVLAFDATTVTASAGQVWTESFWASLVAGSTANITSLNVDIRQTGGAGGTFDTPFVPTAAFTRVSGSGTLGASATGVIPALALFFASGVAIDITLRIGWPQLVLGAVAGDPVPTYGAARAVMYSAPDGSITADKLSENTATSEHYVENATGITGVLSTTYTASFYLKAAERTRARIVLLFGGSNGVLADVNLTAVTIATASSFGTATAGTSGIASVSDGWYRVSISGSSSASTSIAARIELLNASGNRTYTGDGTSGIFIWGSQLVQGTEPYDYVRTDATPVAIGYSAPDGTMTADRLVEDTATSEHRVGSASIAWSGGITYSTSFYVKAAGRSRFDILFGTAGNWVNGDPARIASFNLQTGTVSLAPASPGTASIVAVGGDWYRCIVTATAVAAPASSGVFLRMADSTGSSTYTGDGVSGVLIWGAQLNLGATALPYVETTNNIYPVPSYNDTTVKNALGFAQEFDNAAWTKSNSFVQTNQIRNNTMQGAVAPSTLPTNWGGNSIGLTRTVVGVGTENGVSYIDVRFNGTTTSRFGSVTFEPVNGVAASASQAWTNSSYIKLVGGSFANVPNVGLALYYFDSGSVFLNSSASTLSPSGTLIRYSLTGTTVASTAFVQPAFYFNGANASGDAVDFTIRIGWPQLVQGAVAGDPVPTYGTARAVMYPAPDGSVTADKLVESVTGATSHLAFQGATITAGSQCTFSVYLKKGERNFARIVLGNAASPFQGVTGAVDFVAGTVTLSTQASPTNASAQIQSVGNDWYRVAVSGIFGAGTTVNSIIYTAATSATINYVGDGTSGIFIWGAQLSDSASLDPYVYNPVAAPTSAAYYGPRFDYDPSTLAPRGLLIEEQRTNSIRNNTMVGAVAGTPGTVPTNWFAYVSTGSGITRNVVGVGVEAGVPYVDFQFVGTPSASAVWSVIFEGAGIVSAATGQTWTGSFWVKRSGGSATNVTSTVLFFDETNGGTFVTGGANAITIGTSWERVSAVRTLSGGATVNAVNMGVRFSVTSGQPIDITLRIGLPQLEQGAFATSVIPTTTAAATRTADVATMVGANFSNWYNQTEGTLFAEAATLELGTTSGGAFVITASDGGGNNTHRIFRQSDSQPVMQTITGGAAQTTFGFGANWTTTAPRKLVYAYKLNDFAGSVDASAVQTDTSGTLPSTNALSIGSDPAGGTQLNGWVRRIAYFPRRLANSELQTVTL
jgi:hypothetical protein